LKLLLDQNLSYRLLDSLKEVFPGSTQARLIGMAQSDDSALWRYARDNVFSIVTKDSDFYERSLLYGFPPKIIWLQCGNTSTEFVLNLLMSQQETIKTFLQDQETACLELR
jgi:predicted nuclease of predicted toxin-antitoxin system